MGDAQLPLDPGQLQPHLLQPPLKLFRVHLPIPILVHLMEEVNRRQLLRLEEFEDPDEGVVHHRLQLYKRFLGELAADEDDGSCGKGSCGCGGPCR